MWPKGAVMKKFKLTSTVLILLMFCLILFYQNCSKESGDLGISSGGGGGGGPGNPVAVVPTATCNNNGDNTFNSELRQIGNDGVLFLGSATDDVTQELYKQKQVVPTNQAACPATVNNGCASYTEAYLDQYGPWIWVGCNCMKASQNNFNPDFAINGYKSTNLDLRSLFRPNITSFRIYAKKNKANSFFNSNVTLGNVNGAFADCSAR